MSLLVTDGFFCVTVDEENDFTLSVSKMHRILHRIYIEFHSNSKCQEGRSMRRKELVLL
jgi:hypothetical protein